MNTPLILYVDDDRDVLTSVQVGLNDRGYTVLTAESGAEALQLLQTQSPELIMADLRMQPMNGFELFQEVKKIPKLTDIPFFFLTAVDDFLAQKYGDTLGVDAYITKPVDLFDLDKLIKNAIANK